MRKIAYIFLMAILTTVFLSCEDDVDKNNSIFDPNPPVRNAFDKWILKNYTDNYNIDMKYRMEDIEADPKYDLSPAKYESAVALSIITKHLWLEVYDEAVGVDFLRTNVPRVIHLIGSPAYKSNGAVVLGTAEGGKKITLYDVNSIDPSNISVDYLTDQFFHTLHHEFAHILHQKKFYPTEFNDLSDGYYVGDKCFDDEYTLKGANELGLVTRYARSSVDEDFVEVYSIYITSTQAQWDAMRANGGITGASIIDKKLRIVKEYMMENWGIDIDEVRKIIQRRSAEVPLLDLTIKEEEK